MNFTHRWLLLLGVMLAACAPPPTALPPAPPTATARPPTLTPTPAPTPTPTPIPPLVLALHWPAQVSALQPVPVEAALIPPGDMAPVEATVTALVLDDQDRPYRLFSLQPQSSILYAAPEPLQLPVEATGTWRLVVTVHTALEITGERSLTFQPRPLQLWDLSAVLPAGVTLRIPAEFSELRAEGDTTAGQRLWRYRNQELTLAWAPGPTEPLRYDTALAMLEATSAPQQLPTLTAVQAVTWQARWPAFAFEESWAGASGGPGRAWVIQGPDYRLYVWRVRVRGRPTLTPLLMLLAQTLEITDQQ